LIPSSLRSSHPLPHQLWPHHHTYLHYFSIYRIVSLLSGHRARSQASRALRPRPTRSHWSLDPIEAPSPSPASRDPSCCHGRSTHDIHAAPEYCAAARPPLLLLLLLLLLLHSARPPLPSPAPHISVLRITRQVYIRPDIYPDCTIRASRLLALSPWLRICAGRLVISESELPLPSPY
jgi:hypothetical protein